MKSYLTFKSSVRLTDVKEINSAGNVHFNPAFLPKKFRKKITQYIWKLNTPGQVPDTPSFSGGQQALLISDGRTPIIHTDIAKKM
jgi:hypothetical protein